MSIYLANRALRHLNSNNQIVIGDFNSFRFFGDTLYIFHCYILLSWVLWDQHTMTLYCSLRNTKNIYDRSYCVKRTFSSSIHRKINTCVQQPLAFSNHTTRVSKHYFTYITDSEPTINSKSLSKQSQTIILY
jgi:hypothetical protein